MKGALIELLARGNQDKLFIKKNPSLKDYKNVYCKFSNYVKFETLQTFNEAPNFGKKITCNIDKKGDLLTNCLLEVRIPATESINTSWINSIGIYILKKVKLLIGGVKIDEFTPEYIDAYYKHSISLGRYTSFTEMIKNITGYRKNSNRFANTLFIPLPFWFSKSLGDAFPLLCLQNMDMTIEIEFKDLSECLFNDTTTINITNLNISDCRLYTEMIYLDHNNRLKYLETEHEYLIENKQYQINTINSGDINRIIKFIFNGPIKELLWIYRDNYHKNRNSWNIYTLHFNDDEISPIIEAEIKFNGLDRTGILSGDYFRLVQPFRNHISTVSDYYYFYSFGIEPDNMQPFGYVNMSHIDNPTLHIKFNNNINNGELFLYGIGYNYLKIKNGMAGLLFN